MTHRARHATQRAVTRMSRQVTLKRHRGGLEARSPEHWRSDEGVGLSHVDMDHLPAHLPGRRVAHGQHQLDIAQSWSEVPDRPMPVRGGEA